MKTNIKTTLFLILLTAVVFVSTSCRQYEVRGSGKLSAKDYPVSNFEKMEISGAFEVELVQGDTCSVHVEADEATIEYLKINNDGNTLVIEYDHDFNFIDNESTKIKITYNKLTKLELAGAIEFTALDTIKFDRFRLDVSGACKVGLYLVGNHFKGEVSGACHTLLAGKVNEMEFDLSGAGKLEAFDLKTYKTRIDLSGIGAAEVYATEYLEVNISGIGEVKADGNPKDVNKSISPFGKLRLL